MMQSQSKDYTSEMEQIDLKRINLRQWKQRYSKKTNNRHRTKVNNTFEPLKNDPKHNKFYQIYLQTHSDACQCSNKLSAYTSQSLHTKQCEPVKMQGECSTPRKERQVESETRLQCRQIYQSRYSSQRTYSCGKRTYKLTVVSMLPRRKLSLSVK